MDVYIPYLSLLMLATNSGVTSCVAKKEILQIINLAYETVSQDRDHQGACTKDISFSFVSSVIEVVEVY